jgi:hypothetical protein
MTISEAMSICFDNGTKIYPDKGNIIREVEGFKPYTYPKKPKNINEAISACYFAEAKKLRKL